MSPHTHHHHSAGRALSSAILLNALITLAQFIAGAFTGFLSLTADAAHNLSDVVSLGLALVGEKSAHLPASKTSTYGHKRLETFIALLSAVALVVVAGVIVWSAYMRFGEPQEFGHYGLFFVVAGIGLTANLASVALLRRAHTHSLNMKMAILHLLADAASSAAVIIGGAVVYFTGWGIVDLILSVGIAMIIVWSSLDVFRQTWRIFMEASPVGVDFDAVRRAICAHPSVNSAHHLHIWSLSSVEIAASCHVVVARVDLEHLNRIIAELNKTLREKFAIVHTTIQIESAPCDEPGGACREPTDHTPSTAHD